MKLINTLLILLVFTSCTQTFYVVRHAEKATQTPNMTSDVPLTDGGKQRAEKLAGLLHNKKIGLIYSTNTIRTKTTAEPTAAYFSIPVSIYGPKPDSAFIQLLKSKKQNTLIVGHSNTVDDIVNMLCGEIKISADLKDPEYDNLFVVKRKGKKIGFKNEKF